MIIANPVIRPKEMRLFIDEKVKMKKPAERTMVVSSIALPVEVSFFFHSNLYILMNVLIPRENYA
ncbi:MAG: hypothetical protein CM1200mP28_03860 [Deltaproteobacteria bacterium]|nr:MAG: hypothetical protein CM1200mP28_03860 [Deltaproteobacteria bacterium]